MSNPAAAVSPSAIKKTDRNALATSAWPMIHGGPDGCKSSPLPAPTTGPVTIDRFAGSSASIVTTIDDGLIYLQAGIKFVYCFADDNLEQPIEQVELDASFPAVGGNTVDKEGHVFLTRFGRLMRFDRGLKNPVLSAKLAPADALYNAVGFLADGNLLVTSSTTAHVVSPNDDDGEMPVLSTTDLSQLTYNGKLLFAPIGFAPRPVYDSSTGVYFNSQDYLVKMTYMPQTAELATMASWAFRNPQPGGTFALSNPILVNDQVWTVSQPPADQPMQLFCLDSSSGEVLGQCTPFPMALGKFAAHTLGAVSDANVVVVICDTDDTSGGVVAIDSETMDTLWHFPLAQIGDAFVISEACGVVYIAAFDQAEEQIEIWAITLAEGEGTVLHREPSTRAPQSSLPCIGPGGDLFYPVLNDFLRIRQS